MKLKKKCSCGGKIVKQTETRHKPDDEVCRGYIYTVVLYRYCDECGLMYKAK